MPPYPCHTSPCRFPEDDPDLYFDNRRLFVLVFGFGGFLPLALCGNFDIIFGPWRVPAFSSSCHPPRAVWCKLLIIFDADRGLRSDVVTIFGLWTRA